MQKVWKFITSRTALQEMLKETLKPKTKKGYKTVTKMTNRIRKLQFLFRIEY